MKLLLIIVMLGSGPYSSLKQQHNAHFCAPFKCHIDIPTE